MGPAGLTLIRMNGGKLDLSPPHQVVQMMGSTSQFVALHELLHAIGGSRYDDPEGLAQLRLPGEIEKRLNTIRSQLGLPRRSIYGAVVGPDGDTKKCNFVFEDEEKYLYVSFICDEVGMPDRPKERVAELPPKWVRSK